MSEELFTVADPPPPGRRSPALQAAKTYALERPGVWVMVSGRLISNAARLRRMGFEVAARNVKGREGDLYFRWPEDKSS